MFGLLTPNEGLIGLASLMLIISIMLFVKFIIDTKDLIRDYKKFKVYQIILSGILYVSIIIVSFGCITAYTLIIKDGLKEVL